MTGTHYPQLASPLRIGSMEISNRMVFGPHSCGLWTDAEAYLAYLEARARSGTGLIIAGFAGVHLSGRLPRGVDEDTVYFEHCMALKPIVCEGVDTLVLCYGNRADGSLASELAGLDMETHFVGDCRSPRTVEEAILEGYQVAAAL